MYGLSYFLKNGEINDIDILIRKLSVSLISLTFTNCYHQNLKAVSWFDIILLKISYVYLKIGTLIFLWTFIDNC